MDSLNAPLLRVSRPVSACSRCRSAKIKCDGKLPACTACEKSGKAVECTGGCDQFARGKERSYVSSLETRLEKLEKKLAALDNVQMQRPTTSDNMNFQTTHEYRRSEGLQTPGYSREATPASPFSAAVGGRKRTKKDEDNEIEGLVADLGYMAINATTRDFYGFTEDTSFAKVVLKASSSSKALDTTPRARLPPRHTATQLVQHYFDKIFITLPCLNESSFFGAIESVYRDESTASPFDLFMVYMVLAVGTMSLSISQSRDSMAARKAACFVKAALEYADSVISPSAMTGVQATLLLVQYSMLEPAHFNSWYLIGVASRIVMDLGLHQEPSKVSRKKLAELDLKRRIFYCVYTLDRSISMVLHRPFTFDDESVRINLPHTSNPTFTKPLTQTLTPLSAAIHLFKLRKLQSEWYQFLHQCGSTPMDDPKPYCRKRIMMLNEWLDTIPDCITSSTREWLLLEWHYLNIYIAAPSPKIPRPCDEAMAQIFTNCISYATMFRKIFQYGTASPSNTTTTNNNNNNNNNTTTTTNRFVYTYHDALRTYYVANNFLHTIWHSECLLLTTPHSITTSIAAIESFIFVLDAMTVRWADVETLKDRFRQEAGYVLRRLQDKINTIRATEARERERTTNSNNNNNNNNSGGGGGNGGRPLTTREKEEEVAASLRRQIDEEWEEWAGVQGAAAEAEHQEDEDEEGLLLLLQQEAEAAAAEEVQRVDHITMADFGNVAFYRCA